MDTHVHKRGTTGNPIVCTLSDSKGAINLTEGAVWQVFLTLRLGNSTTPEINRVPCIVDPDQTANRGKVRYYFDDMTTWLKKGTYNAEYKVIDPNGRVYKIPTEETELYKRVVVQETLAE
jgi:hypothetical protein